MHVKINTRQISVKLACFRIAWRHIRNNDGRQLIFFVFSSYVVIDHDCEVRFCLNFDCLDFTVAVDVLLLDLERRMILLPEKDLISQSKLPYYGLPGALYTLHATESTIPSSTPPPKWLW
jgi:hypothetical protein